MAEETKHTPEQDLVFEILPVYMDLIDKYLFKTDYKLDLNYIHQDIDFMFHFINTQYKESLKEFLKEEQEQEEEEILNDNTIKGMQHFIKQKNIIFLNDSYHKFNKSKDIII